MAEQNPRMPYSIVVLNGRACFNWRWTNFLHGLRLFLLSSFSTVVTNKSCPFWQAERITSYCTCSACDANTAHAERLLPYTLWTIVLGSIEDFPRSAIILKAVRPEPHSTFNVYVEVCLIEKDVQMSWSKKNYLKRNTFWYFCLGLRKHWRAIISPYGPIRQKKLPAKRRTRAYLLWPMFIRTMPFSLVFTCHLRCSVKECCLFPCNWKSLEQIFFLRLPWLVSFNPFHPENVQAKMNIHIKM